MNKIILAVISIAVIIFVFSAGIFYQAQKDSQLATKAGITETLAKNLNSKNVTISTRGFVKSISGRTLSIFEGSYNLTIPIRQDAKIYDLGPNSSGVKIVLHTPLSHSVCLQSQSHWHSSRPGSDSPMQFPFWQYHAAPMKPLGEIIK